MALSCRKPVLVFQKPSKQVNVTAVPPKMPTAQRPHGPAPQNFFPYIQNIKPQGAVCQNPDKYISNRNNDLRGKCAFWGLDKFSGQTANRLF
jgi:hypothetical protein